MKTRRAYLTALLLLVPFAIAAIARTPVRPAPAVVTIADGIYLVKTAPMLIHGLQEFHEQPIRLPLRHGQRPRQSLLEARYPLFRRAAGLV
jgi:hypothetical protein